MTDLCVRQNVRLMLPSPESDTLEVSRWHMARTTRWQVSYALEMLRRHMLRVTREVLESWP
jgi:hypothetical protein